jgi:uncharacterized protein
VTVFADSSAIVKLYIPERHHESVRQIDQTIVVSFLAGVEVPSAFWKKHRIGEIDAADASVLSAAFAADLAGDGGADGRFVAIDAGKAVIAQAVAAIARHPIRAYDAVQLASAMVVREALGGLDGFVAFDVALRAAAAAEGLALVPPVLT